MTPGQWLRMNATRSATSCAVRPSCTALIISECGRCLRVAALLPSMEARLSVRSPCHDGAGRVDTANLDRSAQVVQIQRVIR